MTESQAARLRRSLKKSAAAYDPRFAELWEEARRAYADFLEPNLRAEEVMRRWTLAVHLVHNFKSQVLIMSPSVEWPTWISGLQVKDPPAVWPAPSTAEQRHVVDQVDHDFLTGLGFGVPTRSALLALMRPNEHCIIDRWAFSCAIGLAGLGMTGSKLFVDFPDSSIAPIPTVFSNRDYDEYIVFMREISKVAKVDLLIVERACFVIGRILGEEPGRDWGGYRRELSVCLFGSQT